MRRLTVFLLLFYIIIGVSSCRKGRSQQPSVPEEDRAAKQMLQGIWVDEDEQDVAFKAKGDTIFYPDSTSQPVYFQIIQDTLVLHGANVAKYPIIKQTRHLFIFQNQNGDEVKLVLSEDPDDASFFTTVRPQPLNQGTLIKRDTVIVHGSERYHCYVQVNPTSYKVVSQTYNDDGVAVDNVYYDNIVNLNVYHGAERLFGGDFRKQQFKGKAPKEFLSQGILSDIILQKADDSGIHFAASLIIPGTGMTSYQVNITVAYNGRMTMK
jgi:hypothetical protein